MDIKIKPIGKLFTRYILEFEGFYWSGEGWVLEWHKARVYDDTNDAKMDRMFLIEGEGPNS